MSVRAPHRAVVCTLAAVVWLLTLFALPDAAVAQSGAVAATVVAVTGDAQVLRGGGGVWEPLAARQTLYAGDTLRTGGFGSVSLLLADESLVKLHRLSQLTLKQVAPQAGWTTLRGAVQSVGQQLKSLYELGRGQLWLRNKNRAVDIEVRTASVTTGIRGTEFALAVGADSTTTITVLEGVVEAANAQGTLQGTSGEEIVAPLGVAPTKRVLVTPQNAVQWTLAIPAFFRPSDLPLISSDRAALAAELAGLDAAGAADRASSVRAAKLLRDLGRPVDCLDRLAGVPTGTDGEADTVAGWCLLDSGAPAAALVRLGALDSADAWLGRVAAHAAASQYDEATRALASARARHPGVSAFEVQAALLDLLTGRLEDVERRLAAVVAAAPGDAVAWRYRALNAVLRSDDATATESVARAVELAPRSASARIVEAYALQARFDLPGAERANREAIALDPDNVTAYVNLARLQFGDGRTADSVATLASARALAPADPELRVLDGYTALAERRMADAQAAFDAALAAEPRNADAWLGLGLVAMRAGRTADALEAVTSAVVLDPQRSLYMSYWGKMLYQIERFEKALDVFGRAEQLDPRDPTPVFYRAIVLRDLNRPGEAIRLINRAVALNGNRAVYRSRYLLDRDLAVRNVDLSVLYAGLGLDAWSRSRAIDAVKADYRNYSAHLALAGTLARRDDRAFPFANEQLLARLLQPANVNAFNSFNEYTALFEQASLNGIATARGGTLDRRGGELIAFGNLPDRRLAWQAGVFHDATDGWRGSNTSRLSDAAGVVKWEPTARDGLLLAFNVLDTRDRDEQQRRYEATSPSDPVERTGVEQARVEVGWHRQVSRATDVIAYFTYMEQTVERRDHGATVLFPTPLSIAEIDYREDTEQDQPLVQGQLQVMHTRGAHQVIAGGLVLDRPRDLTVDATTRLTLRVPAFDFVDVAEQTDRFSGGADLRFYSAYVHDIWTVTDRLTLDGALYFDRLEDAVPLAGARWTVDGLHPRLGAAWRLLPSDTLRVAAFRYLLPFTPARVDPNDVAGITLVRNLEEGAQVTEFAAQWDHEWARGFLSAGGFRMASRREDRVAGAGGAPVERELEGEQIGAELEINQMLTDALAFSARYRYAVVEEEGDPPDVIFLESALPDQDRVEQSLVAGLRLVLPGGLDGGLTYTRRALDLRAGRDNESLDLLDLDLGYELPRKRGRLDLRIANLFDSGFDWVTDRFVVTGRAPAREIVGTVTVHF